MELREASRAPVFFPSTAEPLGERHRIPSLDAWSALLTRSVARTARVRLLQARLLTSTCTTGRLDWTHGELWLLTEGLLRVSSGFLTTLTNSGGSGLTPRDPYRLIAHDPATALAAHPPNKLIPFAGMAAARLHGGVTTSGLEVVMTDGTRHNILWSSWDPAVPQGSCRRRTTISARRCSPGRWSRYRWSCSRDTPTGRTRRWKR
ncbi:hypothetical protein ACKI14_29635 [Streptomyces turgidiscabies]|uniref:hypothetical protein n=1 Tax=Streptomyces TaxID=1883 RepID=UPI0005CA8F85|nr:hypothetical protein [Streptomyces reticuliscabiei]GAQ72659.1 hypothetical protein T45_04413 [Streptomyces turgidiscabies]